MAHATWTADSQFFVAGVDASGGHQPWAHPIWVYSRVANEFLELAKFGATAVADFTLGSPDILQVKILECKDRGGVSSPHAAAIRLHELVITRRLPASLCDAR
jgi:hypothetical protein